MKQMSKKKIFSIFAVVLLLAILVISVYFLKARADVLSVVSSASISSGDELTLNFTNSNLSSLNVGSQTITLDRPGGFYIKNMRQPTSIKDPISQNNVLATNTDGSLTQTGNIGNFIDSTNGIKIVTNIKPDNNSIRFNARVSKTNLSNTTDTPVNICYSLPFDATGWVWSDDMQTDRTIGATGTSADGYYHNFQVPLDGSADGEEQDCSPAAQYIYYDYQRNYNYYGLSSLVNSTKTAGLSFNIPMNIPRSFYMQYDNVAESALNPKKYETCFDFMLNDDVDKFKNTVDFSFYLTKVNEPKWTFRSAFDKYQTINKNHQNYASFDSDKRGFFYETNFQNNYKKPDGVTPYKFGDFNFRYDWSFGFKKPITDVISNYYEWPIGYEAFRMFSFKALDCGTSDCSNFVSINSFAQNLINGIKNNLASFAPACTINGPYSAAIDANGLFTNPCVNNTNGSNIGAIKDAVCKKVDGVWACTDKRFIFKRLLEIDASGNPRADGLGFFKGEVINNLSTDAALGKLSSGLPYIFLKTCTGGYCIPSGYKGSEFKGLYYGFINPSPFLPDPLTTDAAVDNWGLENIEKAKKAIDGINAATTYNPDGTVKTPVPMDNIALDTYGYYGRENYNTEHFASSTVPLTYHLSANSQNVIVATPILFEPFSYWEYENRLKIELKSTFPDHPNANITVNGYGRTFGPFGPNLASAFIMEQNTSVPTKPNFEDYNNSMEDFNRARIASYARPFTTVLNYPSASKVLADLKFSLFYGFYTWISKYNRNWEYVGREKTTRTDDTSYFRNSIREVVDGVSKITGYYEYCDPPRPDDDKCRKPPPPADEIEDYAQIQSIVADMNKGRWQPVTHATTGNAAVKVERFSPDSPDDPRIHYFTLRNTNSSGTATIDLSIDGSTIGITSKEEVVRMVQRVSGTVLAPSSYSYINNQLVISGIPITAQDTKVIAIELIHPAISITSSQASIVRGQEFDYRIVYKNEYNSIIKNVSIKNVIPSGLTFVSIDSAGSYDSSTRTATWNIGDLAPGVSSVATVKVKLE